MLLILDLDETLVYATEVRLNRKEDFGCTPYFVYKRPDLDSFIENIKSHFEIAVWTASSRLYANEVVRNIFPEEYPLSFVWDRERCTKKFDELTNNYANLKDLKKVKKKGYNLEQVLVVDDTPVKLARSYGNHIRIKPFVGDPVDQELLWLKKYLMTLKSVPNVRIVEKRGWRNNIINK